MFLQLFKQLFQLPAIQSDSGTSSWTTHPDSSSNAEVLARIAVLCQQLLVLVHGAVCRAMFNRDHLSLGLHLAHSLLPEQFNGEEWAVLLSCSSSVIASGGSSTGTEPSTAQSSPAASAAALPSWVGPDRAAAYEQIAVSLPHLVPLARLQDSKVWAPWVASAVGGGTAVATSGVCVPVPVSTALSVLQQLILIAAFQPER